MRIIYAKEVLPRVSVKSIFLAGPTPRDPLTKGWRQEALQSLKNKGYDGMVFVPESRDGKWDPEGYVNQVEWEEAALKRADCILFWVPRKTSDSEAKTLRAALSDIVTEGVSGDAGAFDRILGTAKKALTCERGAMPALTTNIEFGVWQDSGKVVFGAPEDADAVRYLIHYAEKLKIPYARNLEETIQLALDMVGTGAFREGGECEVPLHVWKHKTFQGWLKAQKRAGNRLEGADVLWTFRVGPNRNFVFAWVVHVNVFVASENRNKINEFVFGRTDVSGVVLYRGGKSLFETEVVIIREFRSPSRTSNGFNWEIPAGSSKDSEEGTRSVAVHEVEEESGIKVESSRLRRVAVRQVAGTLSAHQMTLYAVELTQEEIEEVKRTVGTVRGVEEDTERTTAEVMSLSQLVNNNLLDWATLGMVLSALPWQNFETRFDREALSAAL